MEFNIITIIILVIIIIFIRINTAIRALSWWFSKVEAYFKKKYAISFRQALSSSDHLQELEIYLEACPSFWKLFFQVHLSSLRDAFEDKTLFDKIVKLNM